MVNYILNKFFHSSIDLLGTNLKTTLLKNWDQSIQAITWSNDGQSLFVEIGEKARHVIYKLSNLTSSNASIIPLTSNGTSTSIDIHPTNDDIFVFTQESILQPANIYLYSSATSVRSVTDHNKNLLSKVRMSNLAETFSFIGARNETVWGWHIPPVNGISQKAPLAFLIHGGPQNSWYDAWSYRWNFQSFSSQGYAIIAINFHGSDSYGQNFTDSITGQYGTLPFEDLQLGLTAALNRYTYIDGNRAVALGASYGGYMINWIAGHPQMSQRFKALVNHDGLFDMRGMAYSTEELWFSEHDAGGYIQYENPEAFEKFNPVNYVANWTQPMLVIHGGHDYRVPETQGISTFTALQRRGIPSRLLYLPKENHWTVNPFNSLIWFQEVLDWMRHWTN
jgi:dipeptidyl aminopeptidase/acylaminoacyl peptidase